MFASSEITSEFRALTFDAFTLGNRPQCVRRAHSLCRHYVQMFPLIRTGRDNGIALHGKPGCGKTHLIASVCNTLIDDGVFVHYFPWVQGSNDLRDAISGQGDESVQALLSAMKDADVLYIDDLFKGRKSPTDWQLECLFDVVNARYLDHRPILLSSERTSEQIMQVDEGIGSRLYEMTRGHRLVMTLDDGENDTFNFRLRKGATT